MLLDYLHSLINVHFFYILEKRAGCEEWWYFAVFTVGLGNILIFCDIVTWDYIIYSLFGFFVHRFLFCLVNHIVISHDLLSISCLSSPSSVYTCVSFVHLCIWVCLLPSCFVSLPVLFRRLLQFSSVPWTSLLMFLAAFAACVLWLSWFEFC